jgi:hypothetical protein
MMPQPPSPPVTTATGRAASSEITLAVLRGEIDLDEFP